MFLFIQGQSCEFCKPLYVGDARNNGSCVSCYNTCSHRAHVCMNKTQLEYGRARNFSFEPSEVRVLTELSLLQGLCHGDFTGHTALKLTQSNFLYTKCT